MSSHLEVLAIKILLEEHLVLLCGTKHLFVWAKKSSKAGPPLDSYSHIPLELCYLFVNIREYLGYFRRINYFRKYLKVYLVIILNLITAIVRP